MTESRDKLAMELKLLKGEFEDKSRSTAENDLAELKKKLDSEISNLGSV